MGARSLDHDSGRVLWRSIVGAHQFLYLTAQP
jgi:hypothetical protein